MDAVVSADGTPIAFERLGDGPPIVLVGPGPSWYGPLAEELSGRFAVFAYHRRGRGDSGDTAPYAVEREIEDLGAVIAATGGASPAYGHSAGAALALRAAARGLPIPGLVLHEPPYAPDNGERNGASREEFAGTVESLLAEGRRGDAIAHIFNAGALPPGMAEDLMPPEAVEEVSRDEAVLAMAHTFAYDFEVMGDGTVPTGVAGAVSIPALVLTDGADYPWAFEAGEQLADAMPRGRHRVLEVQGSDLDPEKARYADPGVLAPLVAAFFSDPAGPGYAGR